MSDLSQKRCEVGEQHGQDATVVGRRSYHLLHLSHQFSGRRQIVRVRRQLRLVFSREFSQRREDATRRLFQVVEPRCRVVQLGLH